MSTVSAAELMIETLSQALREEYAADRHPPEVAVASIKDGWKVSIVRYEGDEPPKVTASLHSGSLAVALAALAKWWVGRQTPNTAKEKLRALVGA